jgi:hypothetical protein
MKSVAPAGWFQNSRDASSIEPLRTLNGVMRGPSIDGRFNQAGREIHFSFVLDGAAMANGGLRLNGTFRAAGRAARASATILASTARVRNPRSASTDQVYRKQDEPDSRASVGQDGQAVLVSGCEVLFLRLIPGPKMQSLIGSGDTIQLGVVLASLDNEAGEAINRLICRLAQGRLDGPVAAKHIDELNRLLAK